MEYSDVPENVAKKLRKICLALPEVYEEKAWAGNRWRIRKRTFAQVLTVNDDIVMVFRSAPPELDALVNAGHPFFSLGWGRDAVGMVIDEKTDWAEAAELLADSYCVLAPKKLAAIVGDVTPRH